MFVLFFLKVVSVLYNVTCYSADAASLSSSTQDEFLTFQQADGVQAGTDYCCHLTMTVKAYNGTNLPNDKGGLGSIDTQTTPKSEKVCVTTLEGKGKSLFADRCLRFLFKV